LLFNRKINGKLPSIKKKLVVNRRKEARANQPKNLAYHKSYPDNRRNALLEQKRKDKFSSRFNKTPYVVIYRKGPQIVAEYKKKGVKETGLIS